METDGTIGPSYCLQEKLDQAHASGAKFFVLGEKSDTKDLVTHGIELKRYNTVVECLNAAFPGHDLFTVNGRSECPFVTSIRLP